MIVTEENKSQVKAFMRVLICMNVEREMIEMICVMMKSERQMDELIEVIKNKVEMSQEELFQRAVELSEE